MTERNRLLYDCDLCPREQNEYTCGFYSPILERCDFPHVHNVEKEMEYVINHD